MALDAFAKKCLKNLGQLAVEEAVRILGVKDELRRLQEKLEMIKDVLSDAERRSIQDAAVKRWLSKLKDVMYDADDIIDLCTIKGRELLPDGGEPRSSTSSTSPPPPPPPPPPSVCYWLFHLFSSCFTVVSSIPFRLEIGAEIQELNQRLEEISKDRLMLGLQHTGSPSVNLETQLRRRPTSDLPTSDLVGRQAKSAAERLVDSLVKAREDTESLLVFAIVGLAGIGKTTLAQEIYNHQKVQTHFQKTLWVCVSESFSETELLKRIVSSADGDCGNDQSLAQLHNRLISALAGSRFFLVLDDVWQADVWEWLRTPLLHGGTSGNRVLVTSRNENVAKSMGAIDTHRVGKLHADDGWELLCKCVFGDRDNEDIPLLHEIGMKLVDKCDGLPLAIKAIAGVLRTKDRRNSEWEKVHKSHAWSVTGELPEPVRGALYLSYEDLPSHVKQCLLYCSLFPENCKFHRHDLVRLWVAEGFIPAQGDTLLEDLAEDCYNNLISRSLLHLDVTVLDGSRCTMHDLTRSLVMFLTRDEICFSDGNQSTAINSLKPRWLAIYNSKETNVVLNKIVNPQCLRTLHMISCLQINTQDLCQRFMHLRVLDLTASKIESIPISIRNLHHIRYLDLDDSSVRELPESIGCLVNLQFLNLSRCQYLHTLPKSIAQLCNLRRLGLYRTPISHVPVGVGKLRHLNDLEGFVVGEDVPHGCGLDELQSMSQLRNLRICRLENIMTGGIQPLKDKSHLRKIKLEWSKDVDKSLISVRTEGVCEDLSPPSSLEDLVFIFFPGLRFPQWMSMLPNLTYLSISNCLSSQQLPPLGQLPQLRTLRIEGALAVVTIGPEFLGCDTKDGLDHSGSSAAFPKLEGLYLYSMPNLEEWACDVKEVGDRRRATIKLLPRLQELQIFHCPKLRALPEGLEQATALKFCFIGRADSLREIKNLRSLERLEVYESPCLERISNLPALRGLVIVDSWRMLKFVENLNSLQTFRLDMDDELIDCLPEWLLGLIQQGSTSGALRTFSFHCNEVLAKKCREGGEYWTLLQGVPDFMLYVLASICGSCGRRRALRQGVPGFPLYNRRRIS